MEFVNNEDWLFIYTQNAYLGRESISWEQFKSEINGHWQCNVWVISGVSYRLKPQDKEKVLNPAMR